eukprot:TRINITY_DN1024_c0_g1_i3.p1 TRINITY_DN1024_c0_g1~~TRINITY_DN1024_c0_g1_i3.p1  ORF type:complete len:326 (-),score=39.34 TRINITY_DN1024_c0_g1_i3:127-1104(-)
MDRPASALSRLEIGIGTAAWGEKSWGYGTEYNDDQIEATFNSIMDSGLPIFFDTAEIYGRGLSETIIGRCLKKYKNEHPSTPQPFIATKFLPFPWKFTQSSLEYALRGSLERLGLESVDLYQVHGPKLSSRSVETWAHALADVYEKGLCKAVGVSNYDTEQVRRTHRVLAERGVPLTSNQIEYSLLRRNAEVRGHIAACAELGVKVIAYSPLSMGRLTGKYSGANPPKSSRPFGNQPWEKIDPLVQRLREVGEIHGKTPAQVALRWVIEKGALPICGVKDSKQFLDNMGALGWHLTPEEITSIDELGLVDDNWDPMSIFWQETHK